MKKICARKADFRPPTRPTTALPTRRSWVRLLPPLQSGGDLSLSHQTHDLPTEAVEEVLLTSPLTATAYQLHWEGGGRWDGSISGRCPTTTSPRRRCKCWAFSSRSSSSATCLSSWHTSWTLRASRAEVSPLISSLCSNGLGIRVPCLTRSFIMPSIPHFDRPSTASCYVIAREPDWCTTQVCVSHNGVHDFSLPKNFAFV